MKTNSFSIIVAFIALALAGCAFIPLLPVRLLPSATLPSVTVSYSMYGASPRTVEAEVTSRLESALVGMKGVKEISSRSSEGNGNITISIDRHADMDKIRFEISAIVRQIWSELPEGVSYPDIRPNPADRELSGPFMVLTLNANRDASEILEYGEEYLKPLLAKIKGISGVNLSGATPMEWRLNYDNDRLSAIGVDVEDIQSTISQHLKESAIAIAAYESDGGDDEFIKVTLKPEGNCDGLEPEKIPVEVTNGKWIPLSQLVKVERVESRPNHHFRVNGVNSIYVSINADEGTNQIRLSKEVRKTISDFSSMMEEGVTIDILYDVTDSISEELQRLLTRTGLTVIILLLFVGMVSLSWRYVLMISVSLIINLLIAVFIYYIARIEIQLYTLAGITISLNLIIDNLIVMADHYSRHHDRRVFISNLAATLTTIGALSVVYLMDEATRLSLQDFVSVVIINLSVSLIIAFFLQPSLADRLIPTKKRLSRRTSKGQRARLVSAISRACGMILRLALKVRWLMFLLLALVFGITTFLFATKVFNGKYWNREQTEPVLGIYATLPTGATIDQMDGLIKKMESFLLRFPQIEQFQTRVYGGQRGAIEVRFTKENRKNGFPYRLKSEVISKVLTLGGGDWTVTGLDDMGFNNGVMERAGSYRVKLTGYNYDDLNLWANRLRDSLLRHRRIKEVTISSEFSNWRTDYSEFHLMIDRYRMAEKGITAKGLYHTLSSVFGRGHFSGSAVTSGKSERVLLHSSQSEEYDIHSLLHRPILTEGTTVKIIDIATVEKIQAPKEIVKKDQQYQLCIQYDYVGSEKQGKKLLTRELERLNTILPAGYQAEDGEYERKQGDEYGRYWLIAVVTIIIFFITSILFNSLRQPMVIILMIPISFIGVFATFYVFELKFDQGGFASMILIAGITVNTAIYVVSEFMSLRSCFPKCDLLHLYLRAIRVKIVPVVLTVISTVLGFIPFLIGEDKESFWFPLAAGTIGGLVVSFPGLLIYLPLLLLKKRKKA